MTDDAYVAPNSEQRSSAPTSASRARSRDTQETDMTAVVPPPEDGRDPHETMMPPAPDAAQTTVPKPFSAGLFDELRCLRDLFGADGRLACDAEDPNEHARVAVVMTLVHLIDQLDKYGRAVVAGRRCRLEVTAGLQTEHCVMLRIGFAAPRVDRK
jgi:hypothetical protein